MGRGLFMIAANFFFSSVNASSTMAFACGSCVSALVGEGTDFGCIDNKRSNVWEPTFMPTQICEHNHAAFV